MSSTQTPGWLWQGAIVLLAALIGAGSALAGQSFATDANREIAEASLLAARSDRLFDERKLAYDTYLRSINSVIDLGYDLALERDHDDGQLIAVVAADERLATGIGTLTSSRIALELVASAAIREQGDVVSDELFLLYFVLSAPVASDITDRWAESYADREKEARKEVDILVDLMRGELEIPDS